MVHVSESYYEFTTYLSHLHITNYKIHRMKYGDILELGFLASRIKSFLYVF